MKKQLARTLNLFLVFIFLIPIHGAASGATRQPALARRNESPAETSNSEEIASLLNENLPPAFATAISAGDGFTCTVTSSGGVKCWGQ